MVTLINYANENFYKSQKRNTKTGIEIGGFDKVFSYSPSDIDSDFYKKNEAILSQKRGNGYWLWKPYIIKKTSEKLDWGDFAFYCDSGAYFVKPITPLIEHCNAINQDIIVFELFFKERQWTKRDAFILMDCDTPKYTDSKQRLSGYSLWKKTQFSMDFLEEQLRYSQDIRIVSDMENTCGKPNYPEFKENRHDQSVLSLLSKKHNLAAFRTPSQRDNAGLGRYAYSPYPQIVQNLRKRNGVSYRYRIKEIFKTWRK